MRVFANLAAVLLLTAVLAGCFGEEKSDEAQVPEDAAPESGNETAPPPEPAVENQPPVASLMVLDNGTELAAENGSISSSEGVELTFDASASSDPEGGNLSFAWDFGDGSTSDNATVAHAFAAGVFLVALTVTDEAGDSSAANVTVNVTAAAPTGPAPGTVLKEEKKQFKGTYTLGVQGLSCVANTQGVAHSFTHAWEIPASLDGATVAVSKWNIKLTGGTTTIDQAMRFVGPDGKVLKDMDAASDNGETIALEGSFGPGKYQVTVYGCVAVNGSYTLDWAGTLVAA